MLNENKIKLKTFMCNLFLSLFFITHIYYEINIQQKLFLHSTTQKSTNHVLYTKLHMHEIPLHAAIPSPPLTLNRLAIAHKTQLCITSMNLEIPFELTPTNIPNQLHYRRYESRLLASIRNSARPSISTVLDAAVLTTSSSSVTLSSKPKPITLDAPTPTLDRPAPISSFMLDMPALRLSSNCIGISKCAPNYSIGNSYRTFDRNGITLISTLLDDTTTLDVPNRTLLEPASTSEVSTAQAFLTSFSLDFLPANPHDPGPQDCRNIALRLSVSLIILIIGASINALSITFLTIAKFATYDYFLITPRSPQCIYVLCFL
jgi:hypothetical protein